MDVVLIVLVVAIILVGIFFKDFKSVVYFIGIIDIFFRLLHKLITLIDIDFLTKFVKDYIPNNVETIINNYSSGVLNAVLIWVLFLLYVYFLYYLIKYWLKKKK